MENFIEFPFTLYNWSTALMITVLSSNNIQTDAHLFNMHIQNKLL